MAAIPIAISPATGSVVTHASRIAAIIFHFAVPLMVPMSKNAPQKAWNPDPGHPRIPLT
jgi:hypothetical protein